ncbi:hypothetical protein ES703_85663 [subsurface metagenome]
MRGGQSVYRLHADLAERARSRQPGLPGRAKPTFPGQPGLLPGERLRGIGKPAPQKPPELGLNEQGMPGVF